MEILEYPQFTEKIYTLTLFNGLKINLLPRSGFHKTYGILTTDYGSIDNVFVPRGQEEMLKVPDGIAHFLEHKMFEKEDHDAFELFGRYGAEANAFTSFTQTSYIFSTVQNVDKCVETLLDFVQTPYFSEQTVEKEKGIIGQEIKMYDDDPGWQLYFGTIENLYPNEPLSIDISGTIDSIAKITAKDLYTCYETFYHPSNMNLFLVGGFDVNQILNVIETNQAGKDFTPPSEIKRRAIGSNQEEADNQVIPYRMKELSVQRPKTAVGIKGIDEVPSGRAGLTYKLKLDLALYLLYSETSDCYQELYDQGILDDSFGYEFQLDRGFHFAIISGDTEHPQDLSKAIVDIAEHAAETLRQKQVEFELAKKEMLGRYIQSLNSLESIANRYEGNLFDSATVFDAVALLEEITLNDVVQVADAFFNLDAISVYQILPKEDDAK